MNYTKHEVMSSLYEQVAYLFISLSDANDPLISRFFLLLFLSLSQLQHSLPLTDKVSRTLALRNKQTKKNLQALNSIGSLQ